MANNLTQLWHSLNVNERIEVADYYFGAQTASDFDRLSEWARTFVNDATGQASLRTELLRAHLLSMQGMRAELVWRNGPKEHRAATKRLRYTVESAVINSPWTVIAAFADEASAQRFISATRSAFPQSSANYRIVVHPTR